MKVITVEQRNGTKHDVIVDAEFEHKGKLNITNTGYARAYIGGKSVLLHRHIAGAKDGELVDHINRNKLDNRKENLRIVTALGNVANKTAKGVSFHKKSGLWFSRISRKGHKMSVKYFKTEEEATQDYQKRHAEEFGEFSPYYKGERLNE